MHVVTVFVLSLMCYGAYGQSGLCVTKDTSCNHMIPGCKMKYFPRNSPECKALNLNGNYGKQLLDVHLYTYVYALREFQQTAFNMTATIFTLEKNLTLAMRYQVEEYETEDVKNTCREFIFEHGISSSPSVLFYECLWNTPGTEGKDVVFDYQASAPNLIEYRKFFCRVPVSLQIDTAQTKNIDWELFLCVEMNKKVVVHWTKAPDKYSVTKYRVNCTLSGASQSTTSKVVSSETETSFDYPCGVYFVTVEPWLSTEGMWGHASKSRLFEAHCTTPIVVYLLCIISLIMIPIAAYVCWCSWELKKLGNGSKVFLLHTETSVPEHLKVIEQLATFLECTLKIQQVFYINRDKDTSLCKGPDQWLQDTMEAADVVLILSSPKPAKISIYRNLEELVRQHLSSDGISNLIGVQLPYCGKNDFPKFSFDLPCYHLYDDCGPLFSNILKRETSCISSSAFYKMLLKVWGKDLRGAIEECRRKLQHSPAQVIPSSDSPIAQLLSDSATVLPEGDKSNDSGSEADETESDSRSLKERADNLLSMCAVVPSQYPL